MKTIAAPRVGVRGMAVAERAGRLGGAALQASLLRSSLWKPVRPPPMPNHTSETRAIAVPSAPSAPRAAASIRQVVGRATTASTRLASSPTPVPRAPARMAVSRARAATTRAAVALQRTAAQRRPTVGPASPASLARTPSLQSALRELTAPGQQRVGSPRLSTGGGGGRARMAAPASQGGQRSRPAAALAAQTAGGAGRNLTASARRSEPRAQPDSQTPGNGNGGAAADNGNDGGVTVLSGDIVVDGRRMGELAVSSAARSGSAAQTGARSPNFRRTALPSGLSAPLP